MDVAAAEFIRGLIVELVADAVSGGSRLLGGRHREHQQREQGNLAEALIAWAAHPVNLEGPLREAIGSSETEAFRRLLDSSDFENYVRVRCAALRDGLGRESEKHARRWLESIARLHIPEIEVRSVATALLAIVDSALEVALSQYGREVRSRPAPTEMKLLISQLDSLAEIADHLEQFNSDKENDFQRGLSRHRDLMHKATAQVSPPDFSERRLVKLEEIYVIPTIRDSRMQQSDLLGHLQARRPGGLVLLGDPGAGKTTLATYLAHKLTGKSDATLRTAVIVPLRNFERRRSETSLSIAEFVSMHSKDALQMKFSASQWEAAFQRGLAAVFFDGLDELTDVTRRVEMSNIIQAFLSAFPLVPVVVTCRKIGYAEAALPSDSFTVLSLAPFSNAQVGDYARKWFSLEGNQVADLTAGESARRFVEESLTTEELRNNPLLLSLLCILYRSHGYLPENLSDVYRACTELLFEQWDTHRQVKVPRFGDRLRRLLEHLAWWMYDEGLNEIGVTYEELVEKCEHELLEIKAGDKDSAREAATEFVEHCRGRAWVFSDAGSSDLRHRRFCFTHRSFMEYFAARRLANEMRASGSLEGLAFQIFEAQASLMALLTLQILGADADSFMIGLIEGLDDRTIESGVGVGSEFLPSVLQFVDVHDRVTVRTCEYVLKETFWDHPWRLGDGLPSGFDDEGTERLFAAAELMNRLSTARIENWRAVQRYLEARFLAEADGLNDASNVLPLLALKEAAEGDYDWPSEERRTEFEALAKNALERSIHVLGKDETHPRLLANAFLLGLIPVESVPESRRSDLMNFEIVHGRAAYEVLSSAMLIEGRYGDDCDIAAQLIGMCQEGSGAIRLFRSVVGRCLDNIADNGDPVNVAQLPSENFLFGRIPSQTRFGTVAMLHAAARHLNHRARPLLAAALVAAMSPEVDSDDVYLEALDKDFDPFLYLEGRAKLGRGSTAWSLKELDERVEVVA